MLLAGAFGKCFWNVLLNVLLSNCFLNELLGVDFGTFSWEVFLEGALGIAFCIWFCKCFRKVLLESAFGRCFWKMPVEGAF